MNDSTALAVFISTGAFLCVGVYGLLFDDDAPGCCLASLVFGAIVVGFVWSAVTLFH